MALDPFVDMTRNVVIASVLHEFARKKIANGREVIIAGLNEDVGTTLEDIGGAPAVPLLTAVEPMEIVSSSTLDTLAGTGAQKVKVIGLDTNFLLQTEVVSMSGTTPAALVKSYIRINSAHITQVGSDGVAAGEIDVREVTGSEVHRNIRTALTRSLQAHYTCPANKEALIVGWSVSGGNSATFVTDIALLSATIDPDTRLPSDNNIFLNQDSSLLIATGSEHALPTGLLCPPKTDIKIQAIEIAGTGISCITGSIYIVEYEIT